MQLIFWVDKVSGICDITEVKGVKAVAATGFVNDGDGQGLHTQGSDAMAGPLAWARYVGEASFTCGSSGHWLLK